MGADYNKTGMDQIFKGNWRGVFGAPGITTARRIQGFSTSIDAFSATAEVTAADFHALWEASEAVAHDYLYQIDVRDYRRGLLKTDAVVSKQFFELWRKDAGKARDVIEDSAGPIRRTIYFYFARNADGSYTVSPKVLVERRSKVEAKYRVADEDVPATYWYALRRDTAMEEKVGADLRSKLKRMPAGMGGPELGQG